MQNKGGGKCRSKQTTPKQCADFCMLVLEFNIYNKTNYMHRMNTKFRKISLIPPTSENEALSSLIISSTLLITN